MKDMEFIQDENMLFQKGYPKKIYYPHLVKPKIFYDKNGSIVSITKSVRELFIIVSNYYEEKELHLKNTNFFLKK